MNFKTEDNIKGEVYDKTVVVKLWRRCVYCTHVRYLDLCHGNAFSRHINFKETKCHYFNLTMLLVTPISCRSWFNYWVMRISSDCLVDLTLFRQVSNLIYFPRRQWSLSVQTRKDRALFRKELHYKSHKDVINNTKFITQMWAILWLYFSSEGNSD